MTSYAAVGLVALHTADMAGRSTHTKSTSDMESGGRWPSFSWLVLPFRLVALVLCVHASSSHMVSVLSFVSGCL